MTRFKVGDKVRWDKYPENGIGVVISEKPGGAHNLGRVAVRFENYRDYMDEGDDLDFHSPEPEELTLVNDPVNDPVNPNHYKQGSIETWDYIASKPWWRGYFKGNVQKYLDRAGEKAGTPEEEDVRKIIAYAQKWLEILEEKA